MNKKDFDILENADDDTVDNIENKYPVIDDRKREEIYKMTMKKMNQQTTEGYAEYSEKIEGVEKYRRPVWQKISAVAAAGAIVAGGFAVLYHLPRNGKSSSPDYMAEVVTDTTAAASGMTADEQAKSLYQAASTVLTEMNDELYSKTGENLSGFGVICSDESKNINVSDDFDAEYFYNGLKTYLHTDTPPEFFIITMDCTCFYAAVNGTDTSSFATYPENQMITDISGDGNDTSFSISDIPEGSTLSFSDLYDVTAVLFSSDIPDDENSDPQADPLYEAATAAIIEMSNEIYGKTGETLSGVCIISSDESRNINVSDDFDTESFCEKFRTSLGSDTLPEFFVVMVDSECLYVAVDGTDNVPFMTYPPDMMPIGLYVENNELNFSIADIPEDGDTSFNKLYDETASLVYSLMEDPNDGNYGSFN